MSLVQAVGANNGAGSGAGNFTFTVNFAATSAGDTLGLGLLWSTTPTPIPTISSVIDSDSQNWVQALSPIESTSLAVYGVMYYFLNTAAGVTSVTTTFTGSSGGVFNGIMFEESGGFSTLDGTPVGQAQASASTWSSGSLIVSGNNGVAYGMSCTGAASPGYSQGSGWTALTGTGLTGGVNNNTIAGQNIFMERQTYTSSPLNGTGSCSSASNVVSMIMAFKAATIIVPTTLMGQILT
jgi:hypothetical protein